MEKLIDAIVVLLAGLKNELTERLMAHDARLVALEAQIKGLEARPPVPAGDDHAVVTGGGGDACQSPTTN